MEKGIGCTGSDGKQKGESCPKRFECKKFKNFLDAAGRGEFKNMNMDKYYKENYLFNSSRTDKTNCTFFEAKEV